MLMRALSSSPTNVLSSPSLSQTWQLWHPPSSPRSFTVYLRPPRADVVQLVRIESHWEGERLQQQGERERGSEREFSFSLCSQTPLPPTALLNAPHPFTHSTALWLKAKELKWDVSRLEREKDVGRMRVTEGNGGVDGWGVGGSAISSKLYQASQWKARHEWIKGLH